jgi:hypothetical protein
MGDRAFIWLDLKLRSGFVFGDRRSHFEFVRVGNAIGVLVLEMGDMLRFT